MASSGAWNCEVTSACPLLLPSSARALRLRASVGCPLRVMARQGGSGIATVPLHLARGAWGAHRECAGVGAAAGECSGSAAVAGRPCTSATQQTRQRAAQK